MESLKELNAICQKPNYKKSGNWMVRTFLRDAALPVTWLLLHTPVTANQVTLVAIFTGLAGILMTAQMGSGWFLAGTLFLQLWYLLDHVDGQIARYRKSSSLTGRFFDFLMHHLIHGLLFLGLSWFYYHASGRILPLLYGFFVCLCTIFFNMMHDIKAKAMIERLELGDFQKRTRVGEDQSKGGEKSWKYRVFSLMHKAVEMHVMMNVFTAVAILKFCWFNHLHLRLMLYYFYGILIPIVALVKYTYLIREKKVDAEFDARFEAKNSN